MARGALPKGYQTPLTLRYRLPGLAAEPERSETEVRFKLHIPKKALQAGHSAVAALADASARAFQGILRSEGIKPYLATPEDED